MPKNNFVRLIIDTNIWISFLISDKHRKLDNLLSHPKTKILFSTELLEEINRVSIFPKLKKYFPSHAVEEMLLNLEDYIDLIQVNSKVDICRDPNDNFLLSLAKDGNANFLITGDKDLLSLKKFGKTKIITLTNFFEELKHYR
jgi:putative PIN family toxin of toxin-antitoxin system